MFFPGKTPRTNSLSSVSVPCLWNKKQLYKFSWHDAKKQTPNFNSFQNLIGPILTQTMYICIICIYIYNLFFPSTNPHKQQSAQATTGNGLHVGLETALGFDEPPLVVQQLPQINSSRLASQPPGSSKEILRRCSRYNGIIDDRYLPDLKSLK